MKDLTTHCYIDEAGDLTFLGKGKNNIIGTEGVSNVFIIGMLKVNENIELISEKVKNYAIEVANSELYKEIPSVKKRKLIGEFYFHAKDDHPEVRAKFFEFIATINCSFQAVVARKNLSKFENKYQMNDADFYSDILSHLLKDKFNQNGRLILNIAQRNNSTSYTNLLNSLEIAENRYLKKNVNNVINKEIKFNVLAYNTEPLLSVADYFCWSIQRVYEKGELRFYNHLQKQIKLVLDLWETERYDKFQNYYNKNNPLTINNMIKK